MTHHKGIRPTAMHFHNTTTGTLWPLPPCMRALVPSYDTPPQGLRGAPASTVPHLEQCSSRQNLTPTVCQHKLCTYTVNRNLLHFHSISPSRMPNTYVFGTVTRNWICRQQLGALIVSPQRWHIYILLYLRLALTGTGIFTGTNLCGTLPVQCKNAVHCGTFCIFRRLQQLYN